MNCAWKEYLNLVPPRMRNEVAKQGRESLQELRLRINEPPELVSQQGSHWIDDIVTDTDLKFSVNIASGYSPWAAATTGNGYITAKGGHRIGICGTAITDKDKISSVRTVTSLNMRVARDFPGISKDIFKSTESLLVVGAPGTGKTTLLRDIIRQISENGTSSICVVDEREELFPKTEHNLIFFPGKRTDIMTGCPKVYGIDLLLRCMNPGTIAIDEITAEEDCNALMRAGWCGVRLIASAHAGNKEDLYTRQIYKPLLDSGIFHKLILLDKEKIWHIEDLRQ